MPPPHHMPPHHTPPPHQLPALQGTFAGGYAIESVGSTGTRYDLVAIGNLAGLGEVFLTGKLRATGFVSSGHASGQLTLRGPSGTLTLDLEGPRQRAFAHLPQQFHFTVEARTGASRPLHESGIATLDLFTAFHTFTLDLL
jgi:hypothetical protein